MSNEIAERFARDTADHQMTVLHKDGIYRHVQFVRMAPSPETGKPERSSFYWFELVTWPGHLMITGDCGTYTFARIEDMFGFFRGGRINPSYWAEKVQGEMRLKTYSPERFRQLAAEYIEDREGDFPGLAEAVEREIFGPDATWNTEYEDGAREALADFGFGDRHEAHCICGTKSGPLPSYEDARIWMGTTHGGLPGHGHRTLRIATVEGFRFAGTWEWDLGDWDWQFLWCCHAIQWGISVYDGKPIDVVAAAASGPDRTPLGITVTVGSRTETVPVADGVL